MKTPKVLAHDRIRSCSMARTSFTLLCLASAGFVSNLWTGVLRAAAPVQILGAQGLMEDDVAVLFSPDGKLLLTRRRAVYDDAMYSLWDVATNRKVREFRRAANDKSNLTVGGAVAFSLNGEFLAGGFASQVYAWNASNAQVLLRANLQSPRGLVGVAFSPDNKTLVAMAEDSKEIMTVHFFNTATWKKTGSFPAVATRAPVMFSPKGNSLFVTSRNGDVQRLTFDGRLTKTYKGPFANYSVTPIERDLVAIDHQGLTIGTISVASARVTRSFAGPRQRPVGATFSTDGRLLATSVPTANVPGQATGSTIAIWDTRRGRKLRSFLGPYGASILSPDGNIVACAHRLFDVATGKELHPASETTTTAVVAVAYTPGGQVLSLHRGGSLCIWDPAKGKLLRSTEVPVARYDRLIVSPQGDAVLTSRGYLVDISTGKARQIVQYGGTNPAFSPDGKQIAAGITIVDVATGNVVRQNTNVGDDSGFQSHAYSPDGRLLASASRNDGVIVLNDAETGNEIRQLAGHPRGVYSLMFSPDGSHLASTSNDSYITGDQTVRIWAPQTGEQRNKFTGLKTSASQNSGLQPLAISPDSRYVASAFHDHVGRIWELRTGQEVYTFEGCHDREVTSVNFSADGKHLASGGLDGKIAIWEVRP